MANNYDPLGVGFDDVPLPSDPREARDNALIDARHAELRAALLDSAGLDTLKGPEPVIDRLLYRNGLAWLYGKPGTYKTVLALDWACCVSTGLPWQDHEVTRGPVLYLYGEGLTGLRQRVRAWEDRAGVVTQVRFLPAAVQLLGAVDHAALLRLVGELEPSLVVFDTQARVTLGVEENSATEMGRVVDAATAVYRVCESCVLMVHHTPRNGDNPRGSVAIEGAATSLFRAERDGGKVTLRTVRQRDAADEDDIAMCVVPRLGGVVMAAPDEAGTLAADPTGPETLVLRALRDTFWHTGASATDLMEATGLPRTSFYRAVNTLLSRGLVLSTGTRNRSRYELAEK